MSLHEKLVYVAFRRPVHSVTAAGNIIWYRGTYENWEVEAHRSTQWTRAHDLVALAEDMELEISDV